MKNLIIIATCLYSCFGHTHAQVSKAGWLTGTWENKTSKGSMYETWTKVSDTELMGKSYLVKDKDTIVFETIQLIQEKGNMVYIPTVKNQNNGLPVRFASKLVTADSLVFENKEHDFPQTICYVRSSPNTLVAEISGSKNGKERKQIFAMKKLE